MQNIVINTCPKGTLFSPVGLTEYVRRKFSGTPPNDFTVESVARDDPVLVQLMREDVRQYAGLCAHIKIVQVPDDFKWKLMASGNVEWIAADVSGS